VCVIGQRELDPRGCIRREESMIPPAIIAAGDAQADCREPRCGAPSNAVMSGV
jgi:hypothetical protein